MSERWRALAAEQRLAALAAAGLFVSMLLPWYDASYVPRGSRDFVSDGRTALEVFSWVEGAVLLVAAGVLTLLWARSQRRAFHLPGGDGTVVLGAGGWAALLIVVRFFDKPDLTPAQGGAATVGIQWGILVAFATATALAVSGARIRAVGRPEPAPGPDAGPRGPAATERRAPAAGPDATPRGPAAAGRPAREGDFHAAPTEARPQRRNDFHEAATERHPGAGDAPAAGDPPPRQLSFEDDEPG